MESGLFSLHILFQDMIVKCMEREYNIHVNYTLLDMERDEKKTFFKW